MIPFNHTRLNSKNKIILVFLGFILLSSLTPLQSISAASVTIPASAINLSDFATTDSKTPGIASSGDDIYVVWREANDIRFHKSTDAGISFTGTPIDIGDASLSTSGFPKISVDGTNIYSVWRDGNAIKFNDSNDGGVTFAGAVLEVSSGTSTSNRDPQVVSSDSNEVHVVWRDRAASTDNSILYSNSQDNGTSFNSIIIIDPDSDSSNPQPQIATSGLAVYVVWKDSTDILVAESTDNGSTFSSGVDIGDSGSTSAQSVPQIATDDGGNIYVVWQENNDIKAAIKKAGESFGAAITIGDAGLGTAMPSQIATSGNNAYVVWQDGRLLGGSDIKFTKSQNGDPFGAETNLSSSSGFSTLPQITASGSNVFVVWEDRTSDSSGDILIKASSDSGLTFSSGAGDNVSSTNGKTSTEPVISASGSNAFVSWRDSNSGNNDILFKTVTREGADITFDSAQYKLSDTANITVVDSTSSGSIDVNVNSSSDNTGIIITLPETSTGIFVGFITFTESNTSSGVELQALPGDTITASFGSTSSMSSIFSRTIQFDTGSGTITEFNLGSIAHARVIDQNANLDENTPETVEVRITSTADSQGIILVLTETGVNTGVFGGNNGPTQSDLIFTSGSGLVPIGGGNRFDPRTSSITINQTDALNSDNSNSNSTAIDQITVTVKSTSDPTGISLVLDETGVNTAEFTGELNVSTTSDQATNTLKIAAGDFITTSAKVGSQSLLLVTPSPPQDGAIKVTTPSDSNIQAIYKTTSVTITLNDALAQGGGGGGLVRPSLVVNLLAGVGGAGNDFSAPVLSLRDQIQYSITDFPLEIEEMVLNHDASIPLIPMDLGLFGNFTYPLVINDKGFVIGGFSNTLETQTIKTNTPTTIKLLFSETTKIQHLSIYTNLRGANSQIPQSDTQILYNDGLSLQIKDPNGFFQDVSVTINDIDEQFKEAVLDITFAKEMDTSDIIIRAWDPGFNSLDTFLLDAIHIVPEITVESPIPTFDEPVIEELKSQSIPIWIKNNAAWWSEQQISDSDFVAGIEYLIQNKIINVPGIEVSTNSESSEIPDWIKNNASWWSDSLITDGDFVEAMQWLVANGVIQI